MIVRFRVDPSLQGTDVRSSSGVKLPANGSVQFGNQSARVAVRQSSFTRKASTASVSGGNAAPIIFISQALRDTLRLPENTPLRIRYEKGKVRVGPCVGFYVTQEGPLTRPFGEQSRMLEDLVDIGAEYGVDVVVITPGFSKQPNGWRYDRTARAWKEETVPFPDIVIRRSGRFREPTSLVAADLGLMGRMGRLHSLPRASSNKWTFYQSVRSNASIRKYLPSTQRVQSASQLYALIEQMGDVYLKPVAGAQGISIKRLCLRKDGSIRVTEERRVVPRSQERLSEDFQPQTEIVHSILKSEADVEKIWNQIQKSAYKKWVVQESIPLAKTKDGCPVDFRWLVQDSDCPVVTGRVARRGTPSSITTNLHTGGAAEDAVSVLHELKIRQVEDIVNQMDVLAQKVITHLRQKFGPFAEVGVDIGVTQGGKIYVFEVNPTPGRRMLRSLSGNERELSLVRLIEYAIRASGFADGKSR